MKQTLRWIGGFLVVAFVLLLVGRGLYRVADSRTQAQVEKIHATKLTLADVMGENLPPVPENPDATIEGVDANANGIRDDVELAIFDEYPDSAKTRAVLLQYALSLQVQTALPLVNQRTFTSTVEESERAAHCIWSISSRQDLVKFEQETTQREDFVKTRQFNTNARNEHIDRLYENLGSYTSPRGESCDLDLSILPN